jgi:hypothetical protein
MSEGLANTERRVRPRAWFSASEEADKLVRASRIGGSCAGATNVHHVAIAASLWGPLLRR